MQLNQVTLPSTDMARSIDFYQRLGLGLIVRADDRYARFELPDGGSTLSLHRVPHEIHQPRSDHDPRLCPHCPPDASTAVVYFEVDDVDAVVNDLKAAGIEFDSPPTDMRWLWREARLRDPDGNRLCIFHGGENRKNPPWRLSG